MPVMAWCERQHVLTVQGVARRYGDLEALADLDLNVLPGEVVALLGGNGSGKTTALRCIAGELVPTRGTVRIAGADPHQEPSGERARRELAFIPDTPVFYRELTVKEHVQLVAAAFEDRKGVERGLTVLEELGLGARHDVRPSELSSGQRQKLLIACVHARPFRLLLLDEPVLRLDPAAQQWLRDRLAAHAQAGSAVLCTTHQPEFARGLADRAVVLQEGRVIADEPYERFLSSGAARRIGVLDADL